MNEHEANVRRRAADRERKRLVAERKRHMRGYARSSMPSIRKAITNKVRKGDHK